MCLVTSNSALDFSTIGSDPNFTFYSNFLISNSCWDSIFSLSNLSCRSFSSVLSRLSFSSSLSCRSFSSSLSCRSFSSSLSCSSFSSSLSCLSVSSNLSCLSLSSFSRSNCRYRSLSCLCFSSISSLPNVLISN